MVQAELQTCATQRNDLIKPLLVPVEALQQIVVGGNNGRGRILLVQELNCGKCVRFPQTGYCLFDHRTPAFAPLL